jgi:subtilisin family serine protease
LTCGGSGSNAGVISGIQWTATQAKSRGRPAVANMSLGGGKNAATNAAVAGTYRAHFIYVFFT